MRMFVREVTIRSLPLWLLLGAVAGGCVPSSASTKPAPVAAGATLETPPVPPVAPPLTDQPSLASPAPPSAFHVWAEREYNINLEGGGEIPWVRGGMGLSHLVGDRLERDASKLKGIASPYAEGGALLGEFPNNAWLSVQNFVGRDSVEVSLLRWERDRWRQVGGVTRDMHEAVLWRGGRVLALSGYPRATLRVVGGAPVSLPIDASICASSVAALETGEILVAGHGCDEKTDDEWFAQRWSKTGVRGKPEPLGHFDAPLRIVLRSDHEAYVHDVESGRLLAWDGASWAPVEVPAGTKIVSLDVSKQGTLWLAGSRLYRRPKGGSWEDVALPPAPHGGEGTPEQVWAKDDQDVWTVVSGSGSMVLRNQVPGATVTLPSSEELWRESQDLKPIKAATRACAGGGPVSGFFVTLGAVAADAPSPDFNATRAALKGDTELDGIHLVDAWHQKERHIGAEVDDFDQGVKLVALLKRTLPGATPKLVCHVFGGAHEIAEDKPHAREEPSARTDTR